MPGYKPITAYDLMGCVCNNAQPNNIGMALGALEYVPFDETMMRSGSEASC
jgi:hypothetical protein